ncbi:methyl-accepting chemotaxis protein [Alkalilimnicola sp. S0819]|uniref:methyl-accepting chemotaxis protein n=1 Tax=Alkalilimnicola sp. S0819 TaxID=2613922 RepID=UPI0012620CB9|nr:methyl-accepting chemotaxis protein [Alkalilimnicola sp. S0819]KAB7624475.1 twitching motility protein PilJ [Alkalilimnicola sp. S0819]MPQ16311.1 twitching motility protein PilJ [Alkalilimnicola sp. S0819]
MKVFRQGQQTSGSSLSRVLGLLVILSILLMVVSFGYLEYHARFDREYIQRAEAIRVLSQKIAKNASEAANGKTDAFALLAESRADLAENVQILQGGNPETGLPATVNATEDAAEALVKVVRPWEEVRADVDNILSRREMVIRVNELAEQFRVTVPLIQEQAAALADRLIQSSAQRSQVQQATQLELAAERIGRHIGEMLRGGVGNITAAQRLGNATEAFAEVLQGLRASGVSDARGRQALERIDKQFGAMQGQIGEILERSPELFRVRDAADNIFITSEQLQATTEFLLKEYRALVNTRPVPPLTGFAFGLLALVLLFLRGIATRAQGRREVAEKEAEKARSDEQTRRNQEAILALLDEIEDLKEGDLTVHATVGEEITGAIADAFNDTIDSLRSLVTTINETSVQVSSAAQQTQATAMHLAEASDHQAHQITAASAAVNEMAVSIDQVSKNAQESAAVAQKSVDLALKGAETVRRTIDGMDTIREQIQETSKRIKRLGESSQEIGNIVELINDIADQTNILALNASIQAAMAGESGRGFAVVADEVQRLAERSGNATKQIEALVKTIQTDTNEAVISMEQSTAGVVQGARLAEDAGDALREIEGVSQQLAGLIQNISEASRQQANAAANVSDTMNVIQEITSQTSAGTNETATSIGNLADLANDLRNSVAGFKLPE